MLMRDMGGAPRKVRKPANCPSQAFAATCGKDRTRRKHFSYKAVLDIVECERFKTTIRRRQLWFAWAHVRREDTRL